MSVKGARYEYIRIVPLAQQKGRKTLDYDVVSNSSGELLGMIEWYNVWRQHCLSPEEGTIWNADCLADVQNFLAKLKADRKKKR